MNNNARGRHVSPGVYTREVDMKTAVKSLGLTTLGLVGETKMGPAFQPIMIQDWNEFRDYFGDIDASKFKGSGYPKYELPYIAKSYLSESKQLQVCRVLGLSGMNMGPAWVLTASEGMDSNKKNVLDYATEYSKKNVLEILKNGWENNYKSNKDEVYTTIPNNGKEIYYTIKSTVTDESFEPETLDFDDFFEQYLGENFDTTNYTKYICGKCVNTKSDAIDLLTLDWEDYFKDGTYYITVAGATYDIKTSASKPVEGATADDFFNENNVDIVPNHIIAVLRSRGSYSAEPGENDCEQYTNEKLNFDVDTIELEQYKKGEFTIDCNEAKWGDSNENDSFNLSTGNYGSFTIIGKKDAQVVCKYPVSLNPTSKDYIVNVLGTTPLDGETKVYVEELYDLMLSELVKTTKRLRLNSELIEYSERNVNSVGEPVADIMYISGAHLKRNNLYQTYLCQESNKYVISKLNNSYCAVNTIYKVVEDSDNDGYKYEEIGKLENDNDVVKVLAYGEYFDKDGQIACDMSNYKEQFRNATTPWFVSELKGNAEAVDVKKLFRFHTISDGNASNQQVKISIANIKPEDGTFDVLVRDYSDTDGNVIVLERYSKCTMMPGTSNYIGMKIGTVDGSYELKSKYVMLEVVENDTTSTCVPCGFLGYPVRYYANPVDNSMFDTDSLNVPCITYNTEYRDEIKDKKQYFGMSNLTGVDVDILKYKGVCAYVNNKKSLTPCFHLDSIAGEKTPSVDNEEGYTWKSVSPNVLPNRNGKSPVIGMESEMKNTIYENINNRKFTAYFYGGFDGWDEFRSYRTNGDEYKSTKYEGSVDNYADTFTRIQNGDSLRLPANAITTDYYAYLAGIKQFDNSHEIDINIFATPGIDYVNNRLLVEEAIDMIEDGRSGDAVYVVTTPDKPMGATDAVDEMYSADEAVSNLEDSDIDSSYVVTYYPWVKFHDTVNSVYINLPVTKDIVRNMAAIDNKSYPWFTPAGMDRGSVVCEKAHKFIKLDEEDTLYEGRINPIKSFSQDGVKVWGNKTLYSYESPLNRINVRRLMIYMRKLIMLAANKLIFEQNDNTLKAQFEGIVNPILADIKSNRGITDYKLEVSQTPEEMDAHEINVKIWVKPTGSLEYINISFMVTPQSVNFDE